MQHTFLVPASAFKKCLTTEPINSKVSSSTKPHVSNWFPWKRNEQKNFTKADSLVAKCFRLRIRWFSSSQLHFLVGVESEVLLYHFATPASHKRRRSAHSPYYPCRCWYVSNCCPESECQSQRGKQLGPFQNMKVRSGKSCTHKLILLMGLCSI